MSMLRRVDDPLTLSGWYPWFEGDVQDGLGDMRYYGIVPASQHIRFGSWGVILDIA